MAVAVIHALLTERQPVDDDFDPERGNQTYLQLELRDRAFTRNLVATSIRNLGTIRKIIRSHLQRRLPPKSGVTEAILITAVAQLIHLRTADHAAVDMAVRLAGNDRNARHFQKLVNGVLRNVIRQRDADALTEVSPIDNYPDWMVRRWCDRYGPAAVTGMAAAMGHQPPLDVSIKSASQGEELATLLEGQLLPHGTLRLDATRASQIETLPGYDDGAWWVQDAAARLPVLLLGDVAEKQVADLAAAPGGKTAQLASSGAQVTAVDKSKRRLVRLQENMTRLDLDVEVVAEDSATWSRPHSFDCVLLDAPCSATGTLRRHPDIAWVRRDLDIEALAKVQRALLDQAVRTVKPGGLLVYATCSLEPEEGSDQITSCLARHLDVERFPVTADDVGGLAEAITEAGDVQTRPDLNFAGQVGGMDGFFISRLRKIA